MHNYLKLLSTAAFCILFSLFIQPVRVHADTSLPSGFAKTQIASGISQPTAIAQTPDGRIFVLRKGGYVLVIKNNALLSTPALTLPVNADGERGLLGIALDPGFSTNGYIYLYYTRSNPLENRVSRFTVIGDSISSSSEVVILKTTQTLGLVHHAGTVRVGPDGKLWVSIGNNNIANNPQDLTTLHGKLIRINKDGSTPTDNPFYGQTGKESRIWAYGLRNPFRFSFLPDGRPILGDVGDESYEEVNIIEKGGNYGYPMSEGTCASCSSINPIYTYAHNGTSASITGGFIYSGTQFPPAYTGAYFYGDYAKNFIRSFKLADGSVIEDNVFDSDPGTIVDMFQGSDGSLYYVTIVPGAVYKISYSSENQPPTAKIDASPTVGLAPLGVQFTGDGSKDPEGSSLTYFWNFGDGTTSTLANPTHTYTQNGTYTAALTVSDGTLTGSTISFPIYVGKQAPTAQIITPLSNSTYDAGATITASASASDAVDEQLPNSAYNWSVIFHHGTHTHPFLDALPASKSATFVIPDTGEPSADTYYEIVLTVTNSQGFSTTQKRFIYPNKVQLSFATNTPGTTFTLDGKPFALPYTTQAVVGFKRTIDTLSPQTINGENQDFRMWSDGGKKVHTITTPQVDTTYTVSFSNVGDGVGSIHFRIRQAEANGYPNDQIFINGTTAKLTDITGTTVLATTISQPVNGQDGWVLFDNIPVGSYAIIGYKSGYIGSWRQTDCSVDPGDISEGVILQSNSTENFIAAWQTPVAVTKGGNAWCHDVGLKVAENGNLYVRAMLVERDPQIPYARPSYIETDMLNDVTVKLTDTTGTVVKATTTSTTAPWGGDGWIMFDAVKAGQYGLLGYKDGYVGYAKATSCSTMEINSSLQNENTDGNIAAWNTPVTIAGGNSTNCYDIGFIGFGNLHYRVREFDAAGNWTGKYINGATAKLTDPSGQIVYATATSQTINGQDGWVLFDHIESGYYAIITYKAGLSGVWRQNGCSAQPSTTNVTTTTNTDGAVGVIQPSVRIIPNSTVFCQDAGLKDGSIANDKGSIHFRVREFNSDDDFTGTFVNGATAKLVDSTGTVIATETSTSINGQDGWVLFQFIDPSASYTIYTYKNGLEGLWKQTDCNGQGTTSGATAQNQYTDAHIAVTQTNVAVTANTIAFCKDAGLKNSANTQQKGSIHFRVRDVDENGIPTGDFINGATAKLMNETATTVIATGVSEAINGQDGWVLFNNIPVGSYATLAYKTGYAGKWKQTSCTSGPGTTDSAIIQNAHTEGKVAAWQQSVGVVNKTITFCKDLGLAEITPSKQQGKLHFRVLSFDANGNFTGNYINGATAKLTDVSGNTVIKTLTSENIGGQDGWVLFDNIPSDTYGLLVYKANMTGVWKGQGCDKNGTIDNVTITNSNTEGNAAVWANDVPITTNQITYCRDAGLKDAQITP